MTFDFQSLQPHIRKILSAPGTDLSTISAKSVRRELPRFDPSLSSEFLRENRQEVDAVISSVYASISEERTDSLPASEEEGSQETRKRKQDTEEDADDGNVGEDDEDTPPTKKTKREEAGGASKSAKGRGAANGAAKKAGKSRKSAATIDSEGESEGGRGKKTKSRKKSASASAGGGPAKGGFAKEYALSEPLATLLGVEKLSRPQVVKQLWVYIKEKHLQNPENGKEILCDDSMKAVFDVDKIDMFKMNKDLGRHLSKE
ncbi:hypothetical protein AX17_004583 [Amanita inopinata Kibby_2008]|nr:hypothetical protein AX17_004583 [Amanita inopinata Kibby_2008]